MVYILSKNGQPLMPTEDHRKVRLLLKDKKAAVVKRTPFTVRLLGNSHNYKQSVTLGADAGSKNVGISASTETKELYAAELHPRNNVVDLISTRRQLRRSRRNRTTRYRQVRFDNRGVRSPALKVHGRGQTSPGRYGLPAWRNVR